MKNFKILRNFLNLTQLELAKKLSIEKESIAQYESGRNIPLFRIFLKMIGVFNFSFDFLINETSQYVKNLNLIELALKIKDKKNINHIKMTIDTFLNKKKKHHLKKDEIEIELTDNFHSNLKTMRNFRQFTQKQMAEKIEVSQPLYAQYEKKNYPPIDKLIKLSQVLDISIHALATGEKLNFEFADEEFGNTILLADQLLPLEDHKILIRLMEAMLS